MNLAFWFLVLLAILILILGFGKIGLFEKIGGFVLKLTDPTLDALKNEKTEESELPRS